MEPTVVVPGSPVEELGSFIARVTLIGTVLLIVASYPVAWFLVGVMLSA